jgi:hypothetical protein
MKPAAGELLMGGVVHTAMQTPQQQQQQQLWLYSTHVAGSKVPDETGCRYCSLQGSKLGLPDEAQQQQTTQTLLQMQRQEQMLFIGWRCTLVFTLPLCLHVASLMHC